MGLQTSIMYGFVMFIIMLSGYAYSEHTQKVSCQDKARLANSLAEAAKKKYDKAVSGYEHGIKEIDKAHKTEMEEVTNFEKDKHETYCEAANRLFDSTKY